MERIARRKTARRSFSIPVLIVVALLAFTGGIMTGGSRMPDRDRTAQGDPSAQIPDPTGSASQPTPTPTPTSNQPVSTGDNWALILVNWEHALPDDFSIPELTQLRNGHAVDSRAYPALQTMIPS